MKRSWIVAGILGVVSAIVYFASLADYAFPGTSAHLMAVWQGLDTVAQVQYPLMRVFALLLGGGNLIAPVCGVLSVMLLFAIVRFFAVRVATGEYVRKHAESVGTVAGAVAAVVFMLTPGVREAATHLEPRLFDAFWALCIFGLMIPYLMSPVPGPLFAAVIGALTALGFCDSALFVALAPLVLMGIVAIELRRDHKPYLSLTVFTAVFLTVFFFALRGFGLELTPFLKGTAKELKDYLSTDGSLFVTIFATVPFVVSIFSARRAFAEKPGLVQWVFHGVMTVVAVLAIASPLSPSSLLRPAGVCPVVTSAFAAIVAGYMAAFWWLYRRTPVGISAGVVFAFVLAFASLWNLFTFDGRRGAFADEVARKILDDLGERTWFVTDGTLDDHLLLQAAKSGKELHLIALHRDLDAAYLEALGKVVAEKGVGGAKNDELALSLTLGVLPFVQDWFSSDPSVAKEVAIYGAPDLWYSAGLRPVPEFLFFGADESREPAWSEWNRFDALLEAPKGWGSYRSSEKTDVIERMRLSIRRHMGLVANNRGVWLEDHKQDDAAFELYELVLNSIDTDNVCALFNEIEMAGRKHAKALTRKRELERRVKAIVDDKNRRYVIWRLGSYYGYIRNPDMFVRLGFAWARSGRPGDALAQIRRAIDFVPTEKQATLLNMMAALYANENAQSKSKKIYESILAQDANNHDALIGMMRLRLLDGDTEGARKYLERAVKTSPPEGRRARIELAMVAMMKNDLEEAKRLLRTLTDSDAKDLQAWSLVAAITMQQWDAAKDKAAKDKLLADIKDRILPEMERQTTNPYDYYVQTTKAFLLMRQGESKRREARDAFEAAARARPDSPVTQDLVLGLDISLDDRASAERHAREVLRRNRNAPLANYVMGSLAIRRGQYRTAESFLRRAAEAPQPNILALNDLAEVLRRTERLPEAEEQVRKALEKAPNFYILHQTLGEILMDADKDLDEAEKCIRKALELSKGEKGGVEDVRLYASLARVQTMRGDMKGARMSVRRVESKLKDLTEFERREFEEIRKRVK